MIQTVTRYAQHQPRRSAGTNPRALRKHPRALGTNPRAQDQRRGVELAERSARAQRRTEYREAKRRAGNREWVRRTRQNTRDGAPTAPTIYADAFAAGRASRHPTLALAAGATIALDPAGGARITALRALLNGDEPAEPS